LTSYTQSLAILTLERFHSSIGTAFEIPTHTGVHPIKVVIFHWDQAGLRGLSFWRAIQNIHLNKVTDENQQLFLPDPIWRPFCVLILRVKLDWLIYCERIIAASWRHKPDRG